MNGNESRVEMCFIDSRLDLLLGIGGQNLNEIRSGLQLQPDSLAKFVRPITFDYPPTSLLCSVTASTGYALSYDNRSGTNEKTLTKSFFCHYSDIIPRDNVSDSRDADQEMAMKKLDSPEGSDRIII